MPIKLSVKPNKHMKKLLLSLTIVASLATSQAATNVVEASKSTPFTIEMTLGGGGIEVNGVTEFGLDVSLSTNPFEDLPNLWLGVVQGAAWEPKFFGSTDVNVNWSWHLYEELYLNTGWSAGAEYSEDTQAMWRTGPEATLQYYVGDSSFIFAGCNYDLNKNAADGWRYSFGIGITF